MQGLAAIGFDGLLNFEVSAGRQPAGMREAFGRYLHGAAQELMSMM